MRFFFYGTLLDSDVRAAVIGRRAVPLRAATLEGYQRVGVVNAPYPMLKHDPDATVAGGLSASLNRRAYMRITAYEGEDYRAERRNVTLPDGRFMPAWVFLPTTTLLSDERAWSLRKWQRNEKRAFLTQLARWQGGGPG